MSIHSLADRRDRNHAAAEVAFSEIDLEVRAARDDIMARALRRLAAADPNATLEPMVERLGRIWSDAWPFAMPEGGR